jgi:hypothetical protein
MLSDRSEADPLRTPILLTVNLMFCKKGRDPVFGGLAPIMLAPMCLFWHRSMLVALNRYPFCFGWSARMRRNSFGP